MHAFGACVRGEWVPGRICTAMLARVREDALAV